MKKLQYILLVLVLVLASCNNKDSIWNVMGDMDSRVSTLETLCQEMNTNIAALETLIKAQNNGDYITNVTEIRNGNTIVGYTITFNHHDPITIYNGTNGKDGRDGVDGYKPTVGAKQDTDGVYYWTVDGNWLTDANGNKIRVTGEKGDKGDKGDTGDKGQDGQDGTDGTDGTNGVNGNTPQLKIENNYWYISYDGTNWTQLGKATGADGKNGRDGKDGKDGTNGTNGSDGAKGDKGEKGDKGDKGDAGDTIFRSVTQDDNYVYFTLADGTLIKLPKNGGTGTGGTHADDDIIEFKDLNVKYALLRHKPEIDTNHDGEISYAEAKAVKRIIIKNNTDIVSFKELQYFENLTSVNFQSCSKLFELELPKSLDSIPNDAFSYCESLTNFKVHANCKYIGGAAFFGCTSMSTITFEEGSQCEYIGHGAFSSCSSLINIELPNSVRYIGEGVLTGCVKLRSITFPEGYTDGEYPPFFDGDGDTYTDLQTIVWNSIDCSVNFSGNNLMYSGYYYGLSCYGRNKYGSMVCAASNITEILLGDKVTRIPDALCYMTSIQNLVIPPSVIYIGNASFAYCSKLTNVTIPDNVEIIGKFAFQRCEKLTEVTIGKKVASVESVFDGCYALKKIYCKAQQPPIIDNSSFTTSVSVIYVPRESVNDYRATWSNYASKILGYDFE